jgi:hypothetical protein
VARRPKTLDRTRPCVQIDLGASSSVIDTAILSARSHKKVSPPRGKKSSFVEAKSPTIINQPYDTCSQANAAFGAVKMRGNTSCWTTPSWISGKTYTSAH